LILGFEEEPQDFPLLHSSEWRTIAKVAGRMAVRPWRWRHAGFLRRRHTDLLPALHDPLFVRDGRVHDRSVAFSRLIWRQWGGRRVVIPDLAITMANFEAAARRGIAVCKRHFPYFTLYAVMIRKFGNRPRYEMSAIPATTDSHVCGIEFSPILEGADYAPDHYQRFKNAIYDVGLDLGGSYYRFGGVMKPYIRRMFGDEMVDRHRAMKLALDPSFILNPNVVFSAREAA
jgi:FAD/FMN-containing dehydrogenase